VRTVACPVVAVVLTSAFCVASRGAERRSPEIQVLDQLIGRWDITAEGKVLAPQPKTIKATGTADVAWVLENKFQQTNSTFKGNDPQVPSGNMQMTTWDRASRAYRRWTFDSAGGTLQWTGRWDEQAKSFTWHAERGGVRYDQTYRVHSADAHSYEILVRDSGGKVVAELHAKVSRHRG